jgi:hypothetical protein
MSAKQFRSPTGVLEPRISESSTNSNTPRTPKKPPASTRRTPRTGSKARKVLFPISETVSSVAQQANQEMSLNKKATLLANLNEPLVPPGVDNLFKNVDSKKNQLNPASQTRLKRAHSRANSVMSLTNNNPTKITTLYNVENTLKQLRSELEIKQKLSVNQLKTIANLEKQLKRSKERHARATELIKEHISEEPVAITITKTSTEEINKLTRKMENLKGVSNSERSKFLGLIVSLSKKQKALRNALSKVKNVAVSKKDNVDKFKKELQEYETKIQQYEKLIQKISENPSTQTPKRRPVRRKLFSVTQTSTKKPMGTRTQTNFQSKQRTSTDASSPRRKRGEKTREREGQPRARRSLEPIFNRQKNTPPGITKTNLERLFQPFKQPVTVTVAPTISVKGGSVQATGGSAKQGIVMLASKATKKKKKTPPPKPQYLKTPGTIRREKEKARSIAVRKQVVASMRTPTKGQRKTHVIQLIDRVLRKMKAPKDTEKKLIKLYESLSEKQIKSLFGGRSPEFVKKTLNKQVEYLKKKR